MRVNFLGYIVVDETGPVPTTLAVTEYHAKWLWLLLRLSWSSDAKGVTEGFDKEAKSRAAYNQTLRCIQVMIREVETVE